MLLLFAEPKIDQCPDFIGTSAKTLRVMRDQASGSATIAELELFERRQNASDRLKVHRDWRLPVRLATTQPVSTKVVDPMCSVHRCGLRSLWRRKEQTARRLEN